ncbi:ATP-binding cassette domain-containing protein [Microbacterium trichothecenolyticum]|uniref:ABC-2 type transport system ATP-binding protein n=1 Tax=Microbacterium trichothecenolyticum TaxID=69370 RepID=A0ABU0TTW0_MICTR|nr:ABC transporter ATP-binding protein [Microbacterium trichothecenolyticum]MDQ1123093.1 ABC-2 type transport system ATP-binding protein [Microbacterium trichothecenolyticum]
MSSSLIFRQVTKRFGDTTVFEGDSFELRPGLSFLVGRNGAGKSTLVRLATGIERPTAGQVLIFSDPTHLIKQETKRRFGLQLQNDAFLKSVRVGEYIELYKRLYLSGGASPTIDLHEIADVLDIGPLMRSYAYALSGGQKKRVSLFLTIIGRKELLVLDEPTAGIDVDVKDKIMRVIRLLQGQNVDLLVSSHDLSEFFEIADNVLVVDGGIRFNGTKTAFRERFGYPYKTVVPTAAAGVGLPSVEHEDGVSYFARTTELLGEAFPGNSILPTTPKDFYQLATRATHGEAKWTR